MTNLRVSVRVGLAAALSIAGCFADAPPVDEAGDSSEGTTTQTGSTTTSTMSTGAEDVGDVTTVGTTTSVDVTGVPTSTDESTAGETSDPDTGSTGVSAQCGDDHLDVGEDCDDGNTDPGDGCHSDCTLYKLAFVTSEPFAGAMGGLAGADQNCQLLAGTAGLPGVFAAWLSDDASSAALRLEGANLPYRLRDGTRIATAWPDVLDGEIENPIWIDENGSGLDSGAYAWTGTNEFGAIAGTNCAGWTPSAASGQVGAVDWAEPAHWTAADEYGCALLNHLYCFEQ